MRTIEDDEDEWDDGLSKGPRTRAGRLLDKLDKGIRATLAAADRRELERMFDQEQAEIGAERAREERARRRAGTRGRTLPKSTE